MLIARSVLRLGQRQARETGAATPACREHPYPAPPSLALPAPGETGAGRARGRNYRGSRRDDASPHKWGCAARPSSLRGREGAGGEGASEVGMPPSVLTPPEQRAKFSPFEHRRERREADMRDGVGSAPAFRGQKFADACHCATTPSRRWSQWGSNEPQQRRAVKPELRSLRRSSQTGVCFRARREVRAPAATDMHERRAQRG